MEKKQHTVWVLTYNCPSGIGREVYGVYKDEDAAVDAINDELFADYVQANNIDVFETGIEPFYKEYDPKNRTTRGQINSGVLSGAYAGNPLLGFRLFLWFAVVEWCHGAFVLVQF